MNDKSLHLALPIVGLILMMAPVLVAQEQNPTPSTSEQRAMSILKNMSQYLAKAERFSVTIRDGYDVAGDGCNGPETSSAINSDCSSG